MQEARCRSWRQCVRMPALHARPAPSGGAFGALLRRKEFLLNRSARSPRITEDPRPSPCCVRGDAGRVAGQDWVPKSKDYCWHLTWWFSWLLISWKMLLLLVCVFIFSTLWRFFIPTSFDLAKNRLIIETGKTFPLFSFLMELCCVAPARVPPEEGLRPPPSSLATDFLSPGGLQGPDPEPRAALWPEGACQLGAGPAAPLRACGQESVRGAPTGAIWVVFVFRVFLDYGNEPMESRWVGESRWRGMRITWKLDSPFCQGTILIVWICTKTPPKDRVSTAPWAASHGSAGSRRGLGRLLTSLVVPLRSWGLSHRSSSFSLSAVSARGLGVQGLPLHPRCQEDRDIDTVRIFARDPPSRRQAHDIKGPRHFSPPVDFSFVLLSSHFISQNI